MDCQTDAVTQDVTVTITGTVGAGAGKDPTYVSVVGCNQQFAVTNTGGVLTAKLIKLNCPNMAWVCTTLDCTHARIQEFLPGGRGSRPDCQKTAFTRVFLVFNLFYSFTEGVHGYFKEHFNFQRFQSGYNIFQVGGANYSGVGPNANFYRNQYNL